MARHAPLSISLDLVLKMKQGNTLFSYTMSTLIAATMLVEYSSVAKARTNQAIFDIE